MRAVLLPLLVTFLAASLSAGDWTAVSLPKPNQNLSVNAYDNVDARAIAAGICNWQAMCGTLGKYAYLTAEAGGRACKWPVTLATTSTGSGDTLSVTAVATSQPTDGSAQQEAWVGDYAKCVDNFGVTYTTAGSTGNGIVSVFDCGPSFPADGSVEAGRVGSDTAK